MHWLWIFACSTPPAQPASPPAQPASSTAHPADSMDPCPPGMVLVNPTGTVGMKGSPYGIVATAHLAKVEAPEEGCAAAMASTPGASLCWVQTDLVDPVLTPRAIEGTPFCIERHPFPGPGAHYTTDGMTTWDAARLDDLLSSGKVGPRRLCTFTELQAAVAGPQSNRRFVYGDQGEEARCGPEVPLGMEAAIGTDPDCTNPETGVYEYGAVHSQWVRADADFVAHACPEPPCMGAGNRPLQVGQLVVAGGTGRAQTRQAPQTPHTWHDHGEPQAGGCDDEGMDDQPAICAEPDARYLQATLPPDLADAERRWADLVTIARETRSMTTTLEAGLKRPVCPAF